MRFQDERVRCGRRLAVVPIILAIIILFASLAGRAVASETPREVVETPTYTPGRIPFHPGQRLTYQVSWSGFPAAGATILMRPDDDNPGLLTGEINISTNKLVDVVYRMRDYVRENFNRSSLLPRDVYIKQSQNKRGDEYVIKFDHQAGVVDMVRHTPRKTEHVKFKSPNPLGPITGPLMALSQPLTPGDTLVFDVFVGENRYVIALKVEQRERLRTALGVFNTVRIKPTMMYVSNKAARDKAREVTVWVTDDERHLPLRVRAEAFIGYIIADLVQVAGIDLPESIDPSPATAGASPSPSASPTPTP